MRFLRRWLRVERPPGVALFPARTLEIPADAARVYDRCVSAIEDVLGGHVYQGDRTAGAIEAGFGLVNSERLRVTIENHGENAARVRIESRRGAISEQPHGSSYVDTLANVLESTKI